MMIRDSGLLFGGQHSLRPAMMLDICHFQSDILDAKLILVYLA